MTAECIYVLNHLVVLSTEQGLKKYEQTSILLELVLVPGAEAITIVIFPLSPKIVTTIRANEWEIPMSISSQMLLIS